MADKTKPLDILDQVKQAEQATKKRALIKQIAKLKSLAREVLEAKKESELILEDCGVTDGDAKRIIDYVNSLSEVQLSEDDVKAMRDTVKSGGKRIREEVQKQIEKEPGYLYSLPVASQQSQLSAVYRSTATPSNAIGGVMTSQSASIYDGGYSSGNTFTTSASDMRLVNSLSVK